MSKHFEVKHLEIRAFDPILDKKGADFTFAQNIPPSKEVSKDACLSSRLNNTCSSNNFLNDWDAKVDNLESVSCSNVLKPFMETPIKLVVVGSSQCGKSSLLRNFVGERFNDQMRPTIGADLFNQDLFMWNKLLSVEIWDTSGQEKYKSFSSQLFQSSELCILAFDSTNVSSLLQLQTLMDDVLQSRKSSKYIYELFPIVVVGNKCDINVPMKVQLHAKTFCLRHGLPLFWVSAKTGHSVEECFNFCIEQVIQVRSETEDLKNQPGLDSPIIRRESLSQESRLPTVPTNNRVSFHPSRPSEKPKWAHCFIC